MVCRMVPIRLWVVGLFSVAMLAGCDGGGSTPGNDCPTPAAASCAVVEVDAAAMMGSTVGADDAFGGSMCGTSGGGGMGGTGAPDIAFRYTAPEAGRYEFSTERSNFDTVISVREGCDGAEIACNDDVARGVTQSRVQVTLEACQTVLVVVDGYSAAASGDVVLDVISHESACGDGVDNDGDGATDCDDDDCFSLECNGGDDWPMGWQAFEWEVLSEINRYRGTGYNCDTEGEFGPAVPLEMNEFIQAAARGHSVDMGEQNFFEHDSPDGRSFSDRMSNAGFMGATPWGENIAAGQPTPVDVARSWIESDGHCANIMNPAYRVTGIGYALVEGSEFRHYWTQDFAASH